MNCEFKKKVYLHVGTEKTGTSFLQKMLELNTKKIYLKDYYYLKSNGYRNSYYFFLAAKNYRKGEGDSVKCFCVISNKFIEIDSLTKQMRDLPKDKNIIISFEGLYNIESDVLNYIKTSLSENYNFCIIIYLRRQDEYALSWSQQLMKWRNINIPKLDECVVDYQKILEKYSRIFQKENINVRIYEKDCFTNGKIELDFLNSLKLDIEPILPRIKESNIGFGCSALTFCMYVNRLKMRPYISNRLKNEFKDLLENDLPVSCMYSINERFEIIKKNMEINNIIQKKYLLPQNKSIFSSDISKEDLCLPPYKGLTRKELEIGFDLLQVAIKDHVHLQAR